MRRSFYYANGRPLDRLSLPLTEAVVEYFAKNAPFDDLHLDYASDVSYSGAVSPSVLIVAMIYLERMRINNKNHFESSDPADLFTSALLCATKFLYDEAEAEFVYNDEWAHSCSRTLAQVNQNEVEFLNALQWSTMAREKEFNGVLEQLESVIARKEWRRRGFASYSDLAVLASSITDLWNDVLLPAFAVIGMATLTYTATVFGLYSCSLHDSTVDSPRVSVPPLGSLPPLSTPSAHLPPSPPTILSVVFEPPVFSNRVESTAEKLEQNGRASVPENSSSESTLPPLNRNNASFCAIEMVRTEEDVELPSPWTSWLYTTKTAWALWTV